MLNDVSMQHRFFYRALPIMVLVIIGSATYAHSEPVYDPPVAVWLTLDSTLRGGAGAAPAPEIFRIDIPSAGLLTLDVSAPACGPQPKLAFLGGLGPVEDAVATVGRTGFLLVEATPQSLVVAVAKGGSYLLVVSAEDPARPLSGYTLRNAFMPGAAVRSSGRRADPRRRDPSRRLSPTPLKDVEEIEYEADPDLGELCPPAEADDHGDTALCATWLPLGGEAAGTLGNAFGDDEDYFLFVLEDQATVAIELVAGEASFGILYDERQQRLSACDGRRPAGSRLVRTLGPGRYFVRVGSANGAEEPFLLRVSRLPSGLLGPSEGKKQSGT